MGSSLIKNIGKGDVGPFVTGRKTEIPKKTRPVNYIYLIMLYTKIYRPKKVNRIK